MDGTPAITSVSKLSQDLGRLAENFRKVWPVWLDFVVELHRHPASAWRYIDGGIWIASHQDIVNYINATDQQGKPIHPRSFNDEIADFGGHRDYARCDTRLTEIYKRMTPPYPELEQQIFDALASARQHGDAGTRQNVRLAEETFLELQSCLNARFSILKNSFREANDVAKDVVDCLVLTAGALLNSSNAGKTDAESAVAIGRGTFPARVINVMVASPSDVEEERAAIRDAIYEWNSSNAEHEGLVLLPRMWEIDSAPEMGDRPQGILNRQLLHKCALLVAVFWTRLGTPTGKAPSGTVEEIHEHLSRNGVTMIYFSNRPVDPNRIDTSQYRDLQNFKAECKKNGLIDEYDDLSDFEVRFRQHLDSTVKREFPRGAANPATPTKSASTNSRDSTELTEDEETILLSAAKDSTGTIMRSHFLMT